MEMGIFVSEEVLKFNNPETTFTHELVGMKVIENETEIEIGFVSDFLFMPANDVIVIDKGDRYLNIPFIEEFIIDINIKAGFIKINLPNGYEELEELKSDLTGSGND
jgi:16S rRNA processing protein RimM